MAGVANTAPPIPKDPESTPVTKPAVSVSASRGNPGSICGLYRIGMPAPEPAALDRLRGTARDLVSLTAAVTPERMHRAPRRRDGDDEEPWSPAMVLSHLADAEMVYGVRIRSVLADPRPHLPAFDQDEWVRRFSHLDDDPKATLARWRVLRDANLRVLESLDDDEWRRTGVHAERGELSLASIAVLLARHDRDHLDQIRVALAAS